MCEDRYIPQTSLYYPGHTFLDVRPNLYKEFSEPIIFFQSQYKINKINIIKLGLGSGSNIYLCEDRYIPQTSMYYPGHTFLDVRPNEFLNARLWWSL